MQMGRNDDMMPGAPALSVLPDKNSVYLALRSSLRIIISASCIYHYHLLHSDKFLKVQTGIRGKVEADTSCSLQKFSLNVAVSLKLCLNTIVQLAS